MRRERVTKAVARRTLDQAELVHGPLERSLHHGGMEMITTTGSVLVNKRPPRRERVPPAPRRVRVRILSQVRNAHPVHFDTGFPVTPEPSQSVSKTPREKRSSHFRQRRAPILPSLSLTNHDLAA